MLFKEIYDISITLGEETPDNIRGKPFKKEQINLPNGEELFKGSSIEMSVHIGTHVDSPCHMAHLRKTLDEYSLSRFILPATVVEIMDKKSIGPEELKNIKVQPGSAILFKTENSRKGYVTSKEGSSSYVYMTTDALDSAFKMGISLLGFDYRVAEKPGMPTAPIHRGCFDQDVIILEGISLKEVPVGDYTLIALPLKINGIDGSPVRAVLIR